MLSSPLGLSKRAVVSVWIKQNNLNCADSNALSISCIMTTNIYMCSFNCGESTRLVYRIYMQMSFCGQERVRHTLTQRIQNADSDNALWGVLRIHIYSSRDNRMIYFHKYHSSSHICISSLSQLLISIEQRNRIIYIPIHIPSRHRELDLYVHHRAQRAIEAFRILQYTIVVSPGLNPSCAAQCGPDDDKWTTHTEPST